MTDHDKIKFINRFKQTSDLNLNHENLLTYLAVCPIKDSRSLKYLVKYMNEARLLQDKDACLYIKFILPGVRMQKKFYSYAKEFGIDITNIISGNGNPNLLLNNTNRQTSINGDWSFVKCYDGYYIFAPTIKVNNKKVNPLKIQSLNCRKDFEKYRVAYCNELPLFTWKITKNNKITLDNVSSFIRAIPELRSKIVDKRTREIISSTHSLDWNHVISEKKHYIFRPIFEGINVFPLTIPRLKRPFFINDIVNRYINEMPEVKFKISDDFQIIEFDYQTFNSIIDQCIAKENQRNKELREERDKQIEERRQIKLKKVYDRLRKQGVDVSIFSSVMTLKWSEVKFYHKYFEFTPIIGKKLGKNKIKTLRVDDYRCRVSFNYILNYFQERLPEIHYRITDDFKIELCSKPMFEVALADLVKEQVRYDAGVSDMAIATKRITPATVLNFQSAMSKAASMHPDEFKKYKSKFIDFLVEHQLEEYKVVPVTENVSHSRTSYNEASFIFTTQYWNRDNILIIIENINPDRSTIVFKILRDKYMVAIHTIYDYMQSMVINKRSSIRDYDVDFSSAGVLDYWTYNHDSFSDWSYRLTQDFNLFMN